MLALLADPRRIFTGQELALGDEHGNEGRAPGLSPATKRDLRLGAVRGRCCGLHIDLSVRTQHQPQGCPAVDGSCAEKLAQLRDQRIEPDIGRRGELTWPDSFSQLVTAGEPLPVEDQVSEQQPALAARQTALQPLAVPFDDGRPAQLDPRGG